MNVQIILNEDVPNLGRTGDVVKVRPGFARNYLFPRKLAVEANPKSLHAFEHHKRIALAKREVQKGEASELKRGREKSDRQFWSRNDVVAPLRSR